MIYYSLLLSLFFVLLLVIQKSPYLWPGTFFLLVQAGALLFNSLLIKLSIKKGKFFVIPVFKQFMVYCGVMFPIWITLAVTGLIIHTIGKIFAFVFILGFFSLTIVLLLRIVEGGDLLDQFEGKDDRYDR